MGRETEKDKRGRFPLERGDIISFEKMVPNWGAKGKQGPPKLTGVRLVTRTW